VDQAQQALLVDREWPPLLASAIFGLDDRGVFGLHDSPNCQPSECDNIGRKAMMMQEAGANPARSRHCHRGATLTSHGHRSEGEASSDPRARRLASSHPASPGRSTSERADAP
jgi:hypothetical protein